MDELIEYIKNNHSDIYENIKIVNVVYNKEFNSLEIKVVYKSNFNFSDQLKSDLCETIKKFIGVPNLKVDLKTKKSLLDCGAVYELIAHYIKKNYASVFLTLSKNDVEIKICEGKVEVTIGFVEIFYSYLTNKKFEIELKQFLENNYFQTFDVNLKTIVANENLEHQLSNHTQQFQEQIITSFDEPKVECVEIEEVKNVVGEKITVKKVPKLSFLTDAKSDVIAAGTIAFITKKSFVSKRKNKNGEFEQREFFSFSINYEKVNISCVFFPSKDTSKLKELKTGDQIVVCGDLEAYNDRLSLKAKGISRCVIKQPVEAKVEQKSENDKYLFVNPAPYISLMQGNLFDVGITNTLQILSNNNFVVFDLETTGLEASIHEIIEIGACKIINGKITETFSCLVKPKEEISAEITELTGISNNMVKNARSIKEVLQDFYKFTRNSVLVGHNIPFDYKFVNVEGVKQGYVFDNKQIDTLNLSRIKLPGLKNYKLGTVAKYLNVSLEGAHRAINDVIATAEIFLKLVDNNLLN